MERIQQEVEREQRLADQKARMTEAYRFKKKSFK